jgi:hypothetical protein
MRYQLNVMFERKCQLEMKQTNGNKNKMLYPSLSPDKAIVVGKDRAQYLLLHTNERTERHCN